MPDKTICRCCRPNCDCQSWSLDFVNDYHAQVDSTRLGDYLAIRFYVGDQTGFGHTYDGGTDTLENAILKTTGDLFSNATAVGVDVALPIDAADAASKYASWPSAGSTGSDFQDLITVMPTAAADYIVVIVKDNAMATVASDYTFYLSRGGTASESANWATFFTRTAEGVFESIDPLSTPDFTIDLTTLIERSTDADLDFHSPQRIRLELFTRSGEGETPIFDLRHSAEEVTDVDDWDEINEVPSGLLSTARIPTFGSPGGKSIRHPDLEVGIKYLFSEGSLGRVIHSQERHLVDVVQNRIGLNVTDASPPPYFGDILKFNVRRNGVETRGGFMMDQSPPMTCGRSVVHDVEILDSDEVYMRITVDRGHTSLRSMSIQQVFSRSEGTRDLCPTSDITQTFCPGYTSLNHYVAEVNLPGGDRPTTRFIANGDYTHSDIGYPVEPVVPVPFVVEFELDGGDYYTIADSLSYTPTPWTDIISFYVDSSYYGGSQLSSLDTAGPEGYGDPGVLISGYFNNTRMHFWYGGTRWVYRGQDRVDVREADPTGDALDTIVDLLEDGGEYWYRTDCVTYKSIDGTGTITARDAADFTSSPPYVNVTCNIRGGAYFSDSTTPFNFRETAPLDYSDQTVSLFRFKKNPATTRMRLVKQVESWNLDDSPEFVFTADDLIPEAFYPNQLDDFEWIVMLNHVAVTRQKLLGDRKYDLTYSGTAFSFRDVSITLTPIHV